MGLHGFMLNGAVLKENLIVLSGGVSCRPEGQGKGPVVLGKWRWQKGIKVGQDLGYISVWNGKQSQAELQ